MHIYDLIGKVAIRSANTITGKDLFQYTPVLVLSCEDNKAMVCPLEDDDYFNAGKTVCLSSDFLDNAWIEFGVLVNSAVQTKAQVISKMLLILGIQADTQSLKQLCLAITYKDLFQTIEDQLELGDIINALSINDNMAKTALADNASPPAVSDDNYWNGLVNNNTFIKRGSF